MKYVRIAFGGKNDPVVGAFEMILLSAVVFYAIAFVAVLIAKVVVAS
jgi:hypothetical protein